MSPDGTHQEPKRARRQSKDALEFYETPASATRAILPFIANELDFILDPFAGKGAILATARETWSTVRTAAIEIDPRCGTEISEMVCRNVVISDAFDPRNIYMWRAATTVIANPPFSLGQAAVEYALATCLAGTTVAMLLRLAFLEGKGRAQLHREHPSDVYVFSKRPSFSGNGKSDSAAYAWFVWGPGRGGRWQVLEAQ